MLMKYLFPLLLLTIITFFTPTESNAACASPTANAGEMIYNSTENVMQFCNNTDWVNMGMYNSAAGTAGCVNPLGTESEMFYNTSQNVLQFCNGDSWVNVADANKPAAVGTACTNPAGSEGETFYNSTAKSIQFCNGDNWVNAVHSFYGANEISCKAYYDKGRTATGIYAIDPDGTGPNVPYTVYCDMDTDGGGWTIVLNPDNPKLPDMIPGASRTQSANCGDCTVQKTELMDGWYRLQFYRCGSCTVNGYLNWTNTIGATEVRYVAYAHSGVGSSPVLQVNGTNAQTSSACAGYNLFANGDSFSCQGLNCGSQVNVRDTTKRSFTGDLSIRVRGQGGPNHHGSGACYNNTGWGGGGSIGRVMVR